MSVPINDMHGSETAQAPYTMQKNLMIMYVHTAATKLNYEPISGHEIAEGKTIKRGKQ